MVFKDFGDADSYREIGRTAAEHVISGGAYFSYESQNIAIRPLGSVVYTSLPYSISNDPVVQSGIFFLMNLFFYFLAIFALVNILKTINNQTEEVFNFFLSTTIISLFYFSHLPVLAMDIQPLSLTLWAIYFLIKIIDDLSKNMKLSYINLFIFMNLISIAGLLKQSWFVYGFGIIAIVGLFQLSKIQIFQILKDKYFWLIVILGSWGFWLQCYFVYIHFGDFWLIKKDGLDAYSAAWVYPNLALFAYTEPTMNAYLLHSEENTSQIVWFLQKLYLALFEFDFMLYKGYTPHFDTTFYTPVKSIVAILCGLGMVLLTLSWGILQKSNKSIRFFSILAIFLTIYSVYMGHVEIRVYMLPKILIMIVGFVLFKKLTNSFLNNSYVKSVVYFLILILFIYSINSFVNKNNNFIAVEKKISYYQNQFMYFEEQKKFAQDKNIELPFLNFEKLNLINNHKLTRSELIILQDKIYKFQSMIDSNQILIDNHKKNGDRNEK